MTCIFVAATASFASAWVMAFWTNNAPFGTRHYDPKHSVVWFRTPSSASVTLVIDPESLHREEELAEMPRRSLPWWSPPLTELPRRFEGRSLDEMGGVGIPVRGFPLPCVCSFACNGCDWNDHLSGVLVVRFLGDVQHFPLRILPIPFALNTAAWLAPIAMCWYLVTTIRRWKRHQRPSRCARCGYDLRGLDQNAASTCPECGLTSITRNENPSADP